MENFSSDKRDYVKKMRINVSFIKNSFLRVDESFFFQAQSLTFFTLKFDISRFDFGLFKLSLLPC